MRRGLILLVVPWACACSSVADIGKPTRPLGSGEADLTHKKVDEAVRAKDWKTAWNLEAAAGTDRARLEVVALGALDDEAGDAKEMLAQLRKKFGGYSDAAKARVRELTQKALDAKDWKRATDLQLASADDAPAFEGAWDVYAVTPAGDALSILERIQKARADDEEARAKKAK